MTLSVVPRRSFSVRLIHRVISLSAHPSFALWWVMARSRLSSGRRRRRARPLCFGAVIANACVRISSRCRSSDSIRFASLVARSLSELSDRSLVVSLPLHWRRRVQENDGRIGVEHGDCFSSFHHERPGNAWHSVRLFVPLFHVKIGGPSPSRLGFSLCRPTSAIQRRLFMSIRRGPSVSLDLFTSQVSRPSACSLFVVNDRRNADPCQSTTSDSARSTRGLVRPRIVASASVF